MNRELAWQALGATWALRRGIVFGQSQRNLQILKFQQDSMFPKPLPPDSNISPIFRASSSTLKGFWMN
jgi:hypothetical protein